MKVKRFLVISVIAVISAMTFLFITMAAQNNTIVVTPTDTKGWSTADTRPGGAVNFVVDPTSPAGVGALQLTTDATFTAKAQYLHAANTPLVDVTELSYYTKQVSAPFAGADPSYQLPACLNGVNTSACNPNLDTTLPNKSSFSTLVFEPYENPGNNGNPTVVNNVWQKWDVYSGQFYSTRTVQCSGGILVGSRGAALYSLAAIKTICPSAQVIQFGVNIGSNNPSYNVETDLFNFNGTTYDFEPYRVAKTKHDCKNGGYLTVRRADGSSFKNQGQCIKYVESLKDKGEEDGKNNDEEHKNKDEDGGNKDEDEGH